MLLSFLNFNTNNATLQIDRVDMERNKCIDKRFRGSNYPLTMHALDLPHRGGGLIKKPRTTALSY